MSAITQITNETHAVDRDGNLLSDGVRTFTYDAANQLKTVLTNGVVVLTNFYDAKSRRVRKVTPDATHTFFYDDWNLIEERIAYTSGATSTIHYYWGKDLSGTLQGAGGVGGLLYLTIDGAIYIPCYDANGNITRYLDANGNTVAQDTYDAFGNTIAQSGPLAGFFPHRFSTKYFDAETVLYYYGYRFYHPSLMRWLNRDPIEEEGGLNLHAACNNNLLAFYDALGEKWVITRDNKPFATARASSSSDTFQDLAQLIKLDIEDYMAWAHTSDAKPLECKVYNIPNTIIYQYGELQLCDYFNSPIFGKTIFGEWEASNNVEASKLARLGFDVFAYYNASDTDIASALASPYLYQYIYTGHGAGSGTINSYGSGGLVFPGRKTKYGINKLVLQSCGSAEQFSTSERFKYNEWELNVARAGVFIGYEGIVRRINSERHIRTGNGVNVP